MPLTGKEMLKRFERNGSHIVSRRGSHVKVGKGSLREIIPMHKELKKGLERKLLERLESNQEK